MHKLQRAQQGCHGALPDALRQIFPFVVTHRAAVIKQLVEFMSTMVISPASFPHLALAIREGHAGARRLHSEQQRGAGELG
jgi:hypothetical protein